MGSTNRPVNEQHFELYVLTLQSISEHPPRHSFVLCVSGLHYGSIKLHCWCVRICRHGDMDALVRVTDVAVLP